jgi:hypothetical protein
VILSFARTSEVFLAGLKTVSRRNWSERYAWQWVKAWEEGRTRHQAWNKVPRCKGANQIGYFDLTACVYPERLADMSEEDVQAEGGLWLSKEDFIVQNGWEENKVLWGVRFQKTIHKSELKERKSEFIRVAHKSR